MRAWRVGSVVSGLAFLFLALVLHAYPDVLIPIDTFGASAVAPLQTLGWVQVFLVVTALGGGVGIIAVGIGFAYIARLSTAMVLRLTFLLGLVLAANRFLKDLFERVRPDTLTWLDPFLSHAFPSGHASAVMALYGFIAVVLYRRTRRCSASLLPAVVILVVGCSRLVLNAHYVSDVIGGYLLGLFLLAVSFMIPFEKIVRRYG